MTSKVIQGHKIHPFILKSTLIYFVLFVLLIDKKTNATEHFERTKTTFALYKENICLVCIKMTLT